MRLGNYEISIPRLLVVALIVLVYGYLYQYGREHVFGGGMQLYRIDRIHGGGAAKCEKYHMSEKEIERAKSIFIKR